MSSGRATNVNFSFAEFSRRGASTARNPDGWGVAYFDGPDVRLVREPQPTDDSACVRFLMDNALDSRLVISHVRRATQGRRSLPNTQPFARELGGRMHVFSHNGDLDGIGETPLDGCHRPIGDTDSEHAFCVLLGELAQAWRRGSGTPSFDERFDIVCAFAERLRPLGPANFIYSDGDALFVHAHRRTQPGGKSPRPPGVHLLHRVCQEPTCPISGRDSTSNIPCSVSYCSPASRSPTKAGCRSKRARSSPRGTVVCSGAARDASRRASGSRRDPPRSGAHRGGVCGRAFGARALPLTRSAR